jgi:VanZ family protein
VTASTSSAGTRALILWLPVVGYMAGIFYASSIPDPPVPSDVPDINLHALAYFGLMVLVTRAVSGGSWARVTAGVLAIAWCITVAYGATDEWHQMYVPNRHAEFRDLQADAIGALAAGIALKAWVIIKRL